MTPWVWYLLIVSNQLFLISFRIDVIYKREKKSPTSATIAKCCDSLFSFVSIIFIILCLLVQAYFSSFFGKTSFINLDKIEYNYCEKKKERKKLQLCSVGISKFICRKISREWKKILLCHQRSSYSNSLNNSWFTGGLERFTVK